MNLNDITPGDMLRTAGHTATVTDVRRTERGVVIDLVDDAHSRPATVTLNLLRRISANGIEVRVISGRRPPRQARRHHRDVRRFRRLDASTPQD